MVVRGVACRVWHVGYGGDKGCGTSGMQGMMVRTGVACGVWWHDMQGTVVRRVASFLGSPPDVAVWVGMRL